MDANPTTATDSTKADPTLGHTPTPWSFPMNAGWNILAGKKVVARIRFSDDLPDVKAADVSKIDAQAEATGHFIVRAVNAHDALVAALKRAREFCDLCDTRPLRTLEMIDAALLLANGGAQ